MFKDFIITSAIAILGKAIKAKPHTKLAKFLQDEKLKKTVHDVYMYYVQLEMDLDESEDDEG